ncbi:hypothetical protein PIIN_11510 [Serendipita indica DSM 11827]|uniref:Uncharacterized protein n=1 Tax=Serendipita indica (strain DSM 11827) TaxID=1109443 RepID=G4U1U0_SERID|nr:hypothetical protein PIIN_11510 [Serendipita indica DSM 11827]
MPVESFPYKVAAVVSRRKPTRPDSAMKTYTTKTLKDTIQGNVTVEVVCSERSYAETVIAAKPSLDTTIGHN